MEEYPDNVNSSIYLWNASVRVRGTISNIFDTNYGGTPMKLTGAGSLACMSLGAIFGVIWERILGFLTSIQGNVYVLLRFTTG